MATTAGTIESLSSKDETHVKILRERYECPHFRILVIGRANAGKTTILEKVCGVAKGTMPIIYDKDGALLQKSVTHLMPSAERGLHDIEHQITYPGSNFIFHDSRGFESGSNEELNIAQEFIEKRSAEIELKYRLHAIWYCIPMDSPRPILPTELEFFCKGTGKVPLVVVFTKFDGQVINEGANLSDTEDEDKWEKARQIAESIFQTVYLPKVLDTKYPPKAFVRLEDMDLEENNCPELTQHTAEAIDDISIQQLFISTQMNNLDLCVRSAIRHILLNKLKWNDVVLGVFSKFPHFWVDRQQMSEELDEIQWFKKGKKDVDKEIKRTGGSTFNQHVSHYATLSASRNQQEYQEKLCHELLSLFGEQSDTFSEARHTALQVLISFVTIAKLSFWIKKPFVSSVLEALYQSKTKGVFQKLKAEITAESANLRWDKKKEFLFQQVLHVDGWVTPSTT